MMRTSEVTTDDLALMKRIARDRFQLLLELRTALEHDNLPEILRIARLVCKLPEPTKQ